ncbi:MAG: phosphodiester glycosidase family protein [Deltaproteobacteria bacterium]|nr:phosphodiester glycosidase family protein [Deltaproteobacteria bacterium]
MAWLPKKFSLLYKYIGIFLLITVIIVISFKFLSIPRENQLQTNLPLSSIGAELLLLDGSKIVRRGPTKIVVLRFLQPVELRPFHFRHDGIDTTLNIEAWAEKLNAPVVFNAGQFDESLEYIGWLKRDGRYLSNRRKSTWKGLLVSGPIGDFFWGRIVDLHVVDGKIIDHYKHAIQSMMLIDAKSKLRVRDTDLSACRTVIIEDKQGRISIVITEGAVTLGDLARWLIASPLGVVRAMNFDGGIESQMVIDTPELKLAIYGQYGTGATVWNPGSGRIRYPIPAVVAVHPVVTMQKEVCE